MSTNEMELKNVYSKKAQTFEDNAWFLYELLKARPSNANISHSKTPTWKAHLAFVASCPYREWFLIRVGHHIVGSVYLSKRDELGIAIWPSFQGKGYATKALKMMVARHKKRVLYANIAPSNYKSQFLFVRKLGFKHIQETYRLAPTARASRKK